MPITLGCPSCGKRFRARDESAGKKVKCPYCQSAVQVPPPEESAGEPPAPPPPAAPPARAEEPKSRPKPTKDWSWGGDETPEKVLAAGWKRARRGLFWVQFALCWLLLVGFVELGKTLYERQVGPLPRGDGADWVMIEGFINSGGQNGIPVSKEELLNLAAYGIPATLAALLAFFGRLAAGGAPRRSGARGLFGASSLFTLLAFIALAAAALFSTSFEKESRMAAEAFTILAPLAEFLFLVGLACCGVALRRPGTARAVGFLAFLLAAMVAFRTFGWGYVEKELRALPGPDQKLYAQAAFAGGWFLLIAAYWLAIRGVRRSAREFIEAATGRA
jgi:hypothetical protein